MYKPQYTLFSDLSDFPTTVQLLLQRAGNQRVWLFDGAMGAGKTTLIRALCAHLGVLDNVTSPTFSYIQEYVTGTGEGLYHFDFYRVAHEVELQDWDLEAYFGSGYYCFVEWPSKIVNLLPAAYFSVHIAWHSEGRRCLHLCHGGASIAS